MSALGWVGYRRLILGEFRFLLALGTREVLEHELLRARPIVIPDCLIDLPMHLRDGSWIARQIGGLFTLFVEQGRHHLDDGGENGLSDAAATAPWKRMSCTRKVCGSLTDANMPVTSSDMAARSSPVARSAASPATPTSIVRLASNISARVKP